VIKPAAPARLLRWSRHCALRWLLAAGLAGGAAMALAQPVPGPTLRDDRGVEHRLPAPPQRIVSLLPSLTETVCALQACSRLVGVDRYSTWPASVKKLPQLGGLEDTQIERLVALKPDLVLVASSARAIDRLEALGLRVVVLEPRTLQDTERVLIQVARVLGEPSAGPALWLRLQARVAAAAARVPTALRGRQVYFRGGVGTLCGQRRLIRGRKPGPPGHAQYRARFAGAVSQAQPRVHRASPARHRDGHPERGG
jgi:iron complex transport system substrate-binding protein